MSPKQKGKPPEMGYDEEARRARQRAEAERLSMWLRRAGLTKLHKPVHVEGGPCVSSASADEEFVPMYNPGIGEILVERRVTCEACLVAMALLEGEKPDVEPTAYAKAVLPVHFMHVFGRATYCDHPLFWGDVNVVTHPEHASRVTCAKCIAQLRKEGHLP